MALMKGGTLGALVLLVMTPAAAQAQDRSSYTGYIDTTFAFNRNGSVELAQVPGDIVVSTWNEDRIRIRAYARRVPLETRFSSGSVYVGLVAQNTGRNGIGDTRFEITMPATARLKAGSVSGDVTVRGVTGRVAVGSVSGDVVVDGGTEEISVNTVSGDIRLANARGRVTVASVSGDQDLRTIVGDVSATTVSGDVSMRDVRARLVTAKSMSGDVEFAGPIATDGRYEVNAHSGTVTLRLPSEVNGTLTLSTFSGGIDSDIPLTIGGDGRSGPTRGRDIETRLGSGTGGRIVVSTFSGDVEIRRSR